MLVSLAAAAVLFGSPPPMVPRTVSGRVTSADGAALAEVQVAVPGARRSATTDADGRYTLTRLPGGTYAVSFVRIGYAPQVRRIALDTGDVTLDVVMKETRIELPALQVTATPNATSALESPQPTSVLGAADLQTARAASLGETISALAGVRSWSTGSGGIGKPVIRGLSSNRVLVLEDGQRTENQGWGDEHAPQIETADAERIEVIRGPASVLYGSDALGGVVNVVPAELPDAIGRPGFATLGLSAGYATGNEQPEGTLQFAAASEGFGVRGSLTGRNSDDVRTPAGRLFNSGNRAVGGAVNVGQRGAWGTVSATYAHRDERIEIHEDPAEDPTATPYQRIIEDRGRLAVNLPLGASRVEITAGYERNWRREFEASDAPDVALGLLARTHTADVHLHHAPWGQWVGIVGASGVRSQFDKSGAETLIPNNDATNVGVFAFEQRDLGRWHVSLGARYDHRRLNVEADTVLGVSAQQRTYHSLSGNLGLLFRATEQAALVLNVGRGFRAPSAFDLFANGVHEGTVQFLVGDSTLANETSLNSDLALRIQSDRVLAEAGVFLNLIDGFIYPRRTGAVDTASGFDVFQTVQGNARLSGFEASAEYHAATFLHLRAAADYVRGQNTSTDTPLPWIPALRVTYAARFEGHGAGTLREPYLSVGGETNAKQTKLDPDDVAPDGYTLLHVGGGIQVRAGARLVSVDVTLRNVLDTEYASFLSRYKTYALDPGRSLMIRVGMGL
ncbi:MAG TPA: TonB-dependent receptor [Gemmatimonadales bacterium]|nr:TonB-dependent receptor [Gemmatimonadales bacterium]